jgi:hypothetical protein
MTKSVKCRQMSEWSTEGRHLLLRVLVQTLTYTEVACLRNTIAAEIAVCWVSERLNIRLSRKRKAKVRLPSA